MGEICVTQGKPRQNTGEFISVLMRPPKRALHVIL